MLLTFSQVIITMTRPLIGQPSLFNHHHCNYHTITHLHTGAEKQASHRKTSYSTHTRLKQASLLREMENLKNLQCLKFTCHLYCSHAIFFCLSHTCTYTIVRCKISSISCLISFSLWVLYLTITCNDHDITIMITAFANVALSTHAHAQADRYTQTVCKLFLFTEFVRLKSIIST